MMTFWTIAAAMIVVALMAVMFPILRGHAAVAEDPASAADVIRRHRRAELEAECAAGTLGPEVLGEAREELEAAAQAVPGAALPASPQPRTSGTRALVVAAMVLPVLAAGLYLWLGEPGAIGIPRQAKAPAAPAYPAIGGDATAGEPHRVGDMVSRLEQKLAANPKDAEGWILLGRTYLYSQRAADAVSAFERARAVKGDDPKLLADLAEAMAVAGGNRIGEAPARLVQTVLAREPDNPKALWLAGAAQWQKGNRDGALVHWRRLEGQLLPGSSEAQALASYIAQAESGAEPAAGTPPGAAGASDAAPAAAGAAAVRVRVDLDTALKTRAAPEDTVFIFARASAGPRMPIALLRRQVRDLPAEVVLDDAAAMGPGMTLSRFGEVVVSARVSRSGEATPRTGDLEGSSGVVRVAGAGRVDVTIARVVP